MSILLTECMELSSDYCWSMEDKGSLQQRRGRLKGRGQVEWVDDILDKINSRPRLEGHINGVAVGEDGCSRNFIKFSVINLKV